MASPASQQGAPTLGAAFEVVGRGFAIGFGIGILIGAAGGAPDLSIVGILTIGASLLGGPE